MKFTKLKNMFTKVSMTLALTSFAFAIQSAIPVEAASIPTNLRQVDSSSNSVEISGSNFDANADDDDYTAYLSKDNGRTWFASDRAYYSDYDNTFRINNLDSGTHYLVKIGSEGRYSQPIAVITDLDSSTSCVTSLTQIGVTTKSATISWRGAAGADGYEIRINNQVVGTTNQTSYAIPANYIKPTYTYVYVYPYIATANYRTTGYGFDDTYVKLLPEKPVVVLDTWYKYIEHLSLDIKTTSYYEGYESVFYNAKGKRIKRGENLSGLANAPMTSIYSAQVRTYVKINGKKYYSSWSDKTYAVAQPEVKVKKTTDKKTKAKTLTLSWNTIKGASGYDIYVSASGTKVKKFKKVASVKANKKSYVVKKVAGKKVSKNKNYFVYVVAKKKVGSKTMTSSHTYCYSVKGEGYTSAR